MNISSDMIKAFEYRKKSFDQAIHRLENYETSGVDDFMSACEHFGEIALLANQIHHYATQGSKDTVDLHPEVEKRRNILYQMADNFAMKAKR